MAKKRTGIRFVLVAAMTVGLVMTTVLSANASTSHEFVYHADGAVAGEAWFNSGNHAAHQGHLQHGFNSFTIKDRFCGDGWGIGVQWRLSDDEFTYQGTRNCEPVEVTHETGQASSIMIQFNWRPFMWAVDGQHDPVYGAWQSDWMGSNSVDENDLLFTRTSLYRGVTQIYVKGAMS